MTDKGPRFGVLIVDDHPVVRVGLRQVIDASPEFRVVAEASNAEEALRCARELRPRIIVLDLDLGGEDGLTLAKRLQAEGLQIPVVILSMHKRESLFNDAVRLGMSGYVLKENAVTELVDALSAAMRGEAWYSPALSGLWARRQARQAGLLADRPGLSGLTPTERKIVRMIADNLTSRSIAEALGASPLTVETHRKNICRRLGLEGSHSLLEFALRHRQDL